MSAEHDELFQLILGRTTTKAVERILAAGWVKSRVATTPDEAKEAAARGIFNVRDDPYDFEEWDDLNSSERELYLCQARAALEAAAPFIAVQAFDHGWREGKGAPTPIHAATGELLHDQAAKPGWNPYRRESGEEEPTEGDRPIIEDE
ncbi:hypothetical protein M1D89_10025 [Arthrobacter sp. D3-18]